MNFHVYLLIGDDDRPIYIGSSTHVDSRLSNHRCDPTRYKALGGRTKSEATQRTETVECQSRAQMVATEKRLIREREPVLNVLDSMTAYAIHRRSVIKDHQKIRQDGPWWAGWPNCCSLHRKAFIAAQAEAHGRTSLFDYDARADDLPAKSASRIRQRRKRIAGAA